MNMAERSRKAEEGQKVDRTSRAQGNMGDLARQDIQSPNVLRGCVCGCLLGTSHEDNSPATSRTLLQTRIFE